MIKVTVEGVPPAYRRNQKDSLQRTLEVILKEHAGGYTQPAMVFLSPMMGPTNRRQIAISAKVFWGSIDAEGIQGLKSLGSKLAAIMRSHFNTAHIAWHIQASRPEDFAAGELPPVSVETDPLLPFCLICGSGVQARTEQKVCPNCGNTQSTSR